MEATILLKQEFAGYFSYAVLLKELICFVNTSKNLEVDKTYKCHFNGDELVFVVENEFLVFATVIAKWYWKKLSASRIAQLDNDLFNNILLDLIFCLNGFVPFEGGEW